MLRTTITKIKKICTLAFVPRILRGDVRLPPGKFEKFSLAVIRKTSRSTKSPKDRDAECEKCKRIIELAFGPSLPQNTLDSIKKNDIPQINIQTMHNTHKGNLTHMVAPQVHVKNETQCEKCERLIDEAFGRQEDNEKEDILENVSKIPIEDIHLQATTATTNEEKLTQKIEIIHETPLVEAETSTVEGFNLPPKVLGNNQPSDENYNIDTYRKHAPLRNVALKTLDESLSAEYNHSKVDFKDHTYAVKKTISMKENAVFEDCLVEGYLEEKNEKSFDVLQDTKSKENLKLTQKDAALQAIVPNKLDGIMSKVEDFKYQPEATNKTQNRNENPVFEDCLVEGYPETNPVESLDALKSTTTKENEEKIAQKIEEVKTSEVDAAKPIVEFKLYGNILRNRNSILNFSTDDSDGNRKSGSSSERDIQVTLDELAKHCLDSPNNQIDERLLKEVEKLGIPQTGSKNTFDSPVLDNELVQMDVLKKPRKPVKKSEIDLETREYQRDPPSCCVIDKLYPSFNVPHNPKDLNPGEDIETTTLRSERIQFCNLDTKLLSFLPELSLTEKTSEKHIEPERNHLHNFDTKVPHAEMSIAEEKYKELNSSTAFPLQPKFNLNQVIIDPFDKKTLAHDTEEYNNDDSLYYSIKAGESQEERAHILQAENEEKHVEPSQFSSTNTPSFRDYWRTEPVLAVETSRLKEIPSVCHDAESIYKDYEAVNKQIGESATDQSFTPSSVREQYSHSFIQPESMVNPLYDKVTMTNSNSCDEDNRNNVSAAIGPLPKLNTNNDITLSEMLKRVRKRNHLEYCRAFESLQTAAVDPVEGKCGKKTPPCPPPAPKCPPPAPCPPPSCPPPKPPCPKPCKPECPSSSSPCPPPKKKSPCDKFKNKCSNTLGLLIDLFPQINTNQECSTLPIVASGFNNKGTATTVSTSKAVLTEEVVLHLHNLGSKLIIAYRYGKMEALDARIILSAKRSETIDFAKDYEPWTPIPRWPVPREEQKKPFVCPKEGCKLIPPPKLNPPCKENPCINFPKRTFSLVDIFSFSLGKSKRSNI